MKLILFIFFTCVSIINCNGQGIIINEQKCGDLPLGVCCGSPLNSAEDSVKNEIIKIIAENKNIKKDSSYFSFHITLDLASHVVNIQAGPTFFYWQEIDKQNNEKIIALFKHLRYVDNPKCRGHYMDNGQYRHLYTVDVSIKNGEAFLQWLN